MPPGMVMGLMLITAGYNFLRIRWTQPDLGTGTLTNYEYRINGGAWVSTMSALPEFMIPGLSPSTTYMIEVRAQTNVGRGPASAALSATTEMTTISDQVQFLNAIVINGSTIDLTWYPPLSDGGAVITSYEVSVIEEDGTAGPFESTGATATRHRVRGLRKGVRYGFRVRARNSVGAGTPSGIVYATPIDLAVAIAARGQQVPLLDLDRQSLIVRLNNQDSRVTVWWQPTESSFYADLEVPVNTVVTRSRRLVVNGGLLPDGSPVLPGNVVLRAIDDDSAIREPDRGAFRRNSHGLFWEARV